MTNNGPPAAPEELQGDMVNIEIQQDFHQVSTPQLAMMPNIDVPPPIMSMPQNTGLPTIQPRAPTQAQANADGERRSYWRRRLDLWDRPLEDEEARTASSRIASRYLSRKMCEPGSIAAMPIAVQIGFRRKMLSIFAVQLLLLTVCMIILTYVPAIDKIMKSAFDQRLYIILALAVMVIFLGILYFVHAIFPANWIVLLLFTVVLSIFFGSIQVLLDTHAGVFCCAFTFFAIVITVLLSGITHKRNNRTVLISSATSGFLSFSIVAVMSGVIFGIWKRDFITPAGIGYSVLLEFILIMWFSYDASTMYSLISPDEYMNGVIYFYTDLIVLAVISLLFGAIIIFCSACGTASGFGYCDFYACMHSRGDDDDIEGEGEIGPVEVTVAPNDMDRPAATAFTEPEAVSAEKLSAIRKRVTTIADELRDKAILLAAITAVEQHFAASSSSAAAAGQEDPSRLRLRLVCYGLGSFCSSTNAVYQLAFAKAFMAECAARHGADAVVQGEIFDPVMTSDDRTLALNCALRVIDTNECGRRATAEDENTVFFMPHCGQALYQNVLSANWGPALERIAIIGNSFEAYSDRLIDSTARANSLLVAMASKQHSRETQLALGVDKSHADHALYEAAFNDLSVHVFPRACVATATAVPALQRLVQTIQLEGTDGAELISSTTSPDASS
ncbi:TPA: hypothetical protein N0F65_008552 [Lagenidium giganteum]|uniref:SRR1-like domain-containing protein n=1 Tax=Lagenidium giganteum TaxID=4803 RepID=A0AAV2YR74_9STRA|nr:TPA: hypothetical protein N0F65_008552 [Lagenidium giganteum]